MKIILLILMFSVSALSVDCIGPAQAKNFLVYLHGMDTANPGTQEQSIRLVLKNLAEKYNIRIALPRAQEKCQTQSQQICWGWNFNDGKVLDKTFPIIDQSAKTCFDNSKSYALVGFSNGGHVINQIVKDCKKTSLSSSFSWILSIGAAPAWNDPTPKDLSQCGHLTLMAGKNDTHNYLNIKKFTDWLKERNAKFELIEHSGGHIVPEPELELFLRTKLAK